MSKRKQLFHTDDEPVAATAGAAVLPDPDVVASSYVTPSDQPPHHGPTTPAASSTSSPTHDPVSDSLATSYQKRQKNGLNPPTQEQSRSHSPPDCPSVPLTSHASFDIPAPPRKYGSSLGDLVAAATLAEPVTTTTSPNHSHATTPPSTFDTIAPTNSTSATQSKTTSPHAGAATAAAGATGNHFATTNPNPDANKKLALDPKKIRDGFEYMLEKSHQQFAGLKEFTPLGTRPWQDYFKKTFETYTRIWRYQQQYRAVLERSDNFGLKRWQIGEIASKIGQLYYHYYLRTSETNYLLESYIFYYAIRERAYFRDITDAKNPALLVKKIRFYARFIVACVLLNDDELALQLLTESQAMIDQYSRKFRPVDSKEWQLVMQEISTFLEAERKVIPRSPTGQLLSVPLRASEPPVSPKEPPRFHLQEAVLVGGYSSQFKFSELTVDVYRMTQALEFEPCMAKASAAVRARLNSTLSKQTSADDHPALTAAQSIIMTSNQPSDIFSDPPNHGAAKEVGALRHVNPHKHLLFRPTYSNLMQNISQAFKDTSDQTALLLYLSAPGVKVTKPDAALENGFVGGIATRSSKSSSDKPGDGSDVAQVSNCLHPADLIPFTRKSMFLIVESTNSVVFKNIPRIFNQPFICLMSPTESSQKDTHQLGNLFTLFLHSPALGLASLTGVNRQEPAAWKSALDAVEAIQQHIYTLLTDAVTDKGIKKFLSDHLLRQLIIRFVFCRFVLTHHQHHTNPTLLPSSSPELPEDIFNSSTLADKVRAAIVALLVQDQFPSLFTVTEPSNHESLSPEPTSAQPAAPQGQSESMEIDSVVTPTETA